VERVTTLQVRAADICRTAADVSAAKSVGARFGACGSLQMASLAPISPHLAHENSTLREQCFV
jgi:hypothetical protein